MLKTSLKHGRRLASALKYVNKADISSRWKGPYALPLNNAQSLKSQALPIQANLEVEQEAIDFEIIELFFFAYRDFISDPDAILEKSDMGRAHHRVVHFVNREPGMTVATLLDTLKITKQSLARVLKQLLDSGYIRQEAGPEDRRQRKLYTTPLGQKLALALASPQARRIERAFAEAGPDARPHIIRFLTGMRDRQAPQHNTATDTKG